MKVKNYNGELRQQILICSLKEEELATSVIRLMLRTVKPQSKTLGNKSSSLSFKNKIDILYDLGDLNKEEYDNLIKFMEIRNQFIHNPNCSSFEELIDEVPEMKNVLIKSIPPNWKELEKIPSETQLTIAPNEFFYKLGYKYLYVKTWATLFKRRVEYKKGQTLEMERFVDAKVLSNFSGIYKKAIEEYNKNNSVINGIGLHFATGVFSEFKTAELKKEIDLALIQEKLSVYDEIIKTEGIEKEIFKRRTDIDAEIKEEIKRMREGNSKETSV